MSTTQITNSARRLADKYRQCYCGGHFGCEDCHRDICFCVCEKDPTPHSREAVTSGYVNPSQARLDAWTQKQELTR